MPKKQKQKTPKKKKRLAVDFAQIRPLPERVVVTDVELDALAKSLGDLPDGYREFMTKLGPGEYGGGFFVYPPERVAARTKEERAFVGDNLDLWVNAKASLSKDDVARLVFIAHATAGDLGKLAFVSGAPDRLLWFPRPETGSRFEEVGPTFAHAIHGWVEADED